jgi:hypothetical protein
MSSFDLTVVVEAEYVHITTAGKYSLDGLFDLLKTARDEAAKAGKANVLIDCSVVEGNMTEAERFQGAETIAELFGPRMKLAAIMPPRTITGLGQLAAENRGARFFVTPSEDEAVRWLLA